MSEVEILTIDGRNRRERAEFLVLISDLTNVHLRTIYDRVRELRQFLPDAEKKLVTMAVDATKIDRVRRRMLEEKEQFEEMEKNE